MWIQGQEAYSKSTQRALGMWTAALGFVFFFFPHSIYFPEISIYSYMPLFPSTIFCSFWRACQSGRLKDKSYQKSPLLSLSLSEYLLTSIWSLTAWRYFLLVKLTVVCNVPVLHLSTYPGRESSGQDWGSGAAYCSCFGNLQSVSWGACNRPWELYLVLLWKNNTFSFQRSWLPTVAVFQKAVWQWSKV